MSYRQLIVVVLGFILIFLTCQNVPPDLPDARQNWTHFVRTGGHGLSKDRVDAIIKSATETHLFGIEVDNDIPGRYESFLDPTEKLEALRAMADAAHAVGNYAYVYIAGLECITANADKTDQTFFKQHPDWVQRKITGEPAVFGGGDAFWIGEGDEDVWISPFAMEWRKIYMERVRQIAGTGIDGIYVDIPYWMTHFDGWEDTWASFDDYTVAAFQKETGLNAKTDLKLGDFTDANFRKWIDFRIKTLTAFMKEIDDNVKSVNPKAMTIAEIYPGFGEEAVRVGADVYDMYPAVDVIAHEYSAGGSAATRQPIAWFTYMAGMYTFRAFAEGKASWMLSYSWDNTEGIDPREAMKNLALSQVMAGTNFWDARGHVMSGSNDYPTRKVIMKWIADHEKTLYLPRQPLKPVGIYFSNKTRDYFADEFYAAYTGFMQLLLQTHTEFQILTPRTLNAFQGEVLILPDVRCISDAEVTFLQKYMASGKKLMVTGQSGDFDELGYRRTYNPVHKLLDLRDITQPEVRVGKFVYRPACLGKDFYNIARTEFNESAWSGEMKAEGIITLTDEFLKGLWEVLNYQSAVRIVASPFVSTQTARVDDKIHVFLANFKGLKGKSVDRQIPESGVRIEFPATANRKVIFLPFLEEARELNAQYIDGKVVCELPEILKGAIVWME